MRVQFTETDLAVQMRIKTVFDPEWLLNPAKVFPLDGRCRKRSAPRFRPRESEPPNGVSSASEARHEPASRPGAPTCQTR